MSNRCTNQSKHIPSLEGAKEQLRLHHEWEYDFDPIFRFVLMFTPEDREHEFRERLADLVSFVRTRAIEDGFSFSQVFQKDKDRRAYDLARDNMKRTRAVFDGLLMIRQVQEMIENGDRAAGLDILYDRFDEKCNERDWWWLADVLRGLDERACDEALLLSILTVTGPTNQIHKDLRGPFYRRVEAELKRRHANDPDLVARLLRGLD